MLGETLKFTVPFPVPFVPEVMETQERDSLAVQEQPAWVVTLVLPVPPEEAKTLAVGEIE